MFRTHLSAALLGCMASAAAQAAPINLVANGSFETGLTGWVQSGPSTYAQNPIVAIVYNSSANYPTGAFGEAVAPDSATSASPDAAGNKAAYFVDDFAHNQSLTQTIFLAAGTYQLGFDAYAPRNGYGNAGDAQFTASIAGATIANYAVSSGPAATWQDYSGFATVSAAGAYAVSFVFNSNQNPSKDVVIDKVYVIATSQNDGTTIPPAVPEPASLALLAAGLLGAVATRPRRRPGARRGLVN